MDHPWLVFLIVVGVLVAIYILYRSTKPQVKVIKEGTQVAVFSRGHFDRVAGPGWVPMHRFETIEREFSVRNEPRYYSVDGLFLYKQPIGLTLSFFSQFDPKRAAGNDKELLRRLVMFSDADREQHVANAVRAVLISRLGAIERSKPLPPKATIVDRILPIVPGTADCEALLAEVRQDLDGQLRRLGVFVDPTRPFMITEIMPPEEMRKGFSRNRVIDLLRMKLPGLREDLLLQAVAAMEGLNIGLSQDTFVVTGNAAQEALLELKKDEDGVDPKLKIRTQPPKEAEKPSVSQSRSTEPRPPDQKETLTKDDLSYLKRIPRNGQGQRAA